MHRAPVMKLLRHYAAQPLGAEETHVVTDTIAFVESHRDCLARTCRPGHLTASAWIVDRRGSHALLTHHRKLGKWLQLGGHADGDADLLAVALREGREESGLSDLRVLSDSVYDLDRHLIPARMDEPEHYHYDVRFIFAADGSEPLVITNESKDLAWVPLAEIGRFNAEESIARMVRKTARYLNGR